MKKIIILIISILLVGAVIVSVFLLSNKDDIKTLVSFDNKTTIEINTSHTIKEFFTIENGKLLNGDEEIISSKLGITNITVKYKDIKEKELSNNYQIRIIDTIPPEVEGIKDITITINDKVDFYKDLVIKDNSNEEVSKDIIGTYDLTKAGTYNLKYVIKDSSGNETSKDFKLIVKEKTVKKNSKTYYIKVNKTQNVVMVYTKDGNDEYTKLVKTFVCSAGNNTPVGTFTTGSKYEILSLVGKVYGHYTVQIKGPYWFHSVPYYSKPAKNGNWDDLEYEEYNKLGSIASKGCIRLAVIDSKWIYDNIPKGTTVEIYESNSLPEGVTKPTPIKIDVNDIERRGWDPTDPDSDNPWKN